MADSFSDLGRYVSILDRLMKMYYEHALSGFEIGWGQQFYVEYLYDHPGASAQEMAACIRVDKATLTKVIKRLEELDYIRTDRSVKDKRVKLLYLTEKAVPAAKRIKEIHRSFYDALCTDIASSDIRAVERTLAHMTENLNQKIWHRMEE